MNYKGYYSLTRVPDKEKMDLYLAKARELNPEDPPTVALISYDAPEDFPVHIRDQMKAHIRDNPEGCYVVFA